MILYDLPTGMLLLRLWMIQDYDSDRTICSRCGNEKLDVHKICSDCYQQECFKAVRDIHGSDALYYTVPVVLEKNYEAPTIIF